MTKTYKVTGMACDGCVRAVSKAIKAAAAQAEVAVDLQRGLVTVGGDVTEASVEQAIEDAGFGFMGRAN